MEHLKRRSTVPQTSSVASMVTRPILIPHFFIFLSRLPVSRVILLLATFALSAAPRRFYVVGIAAGNRVPPPPSPPCVAGRSGDGALPCLGFLPVLPRRTPLFLPSSVLFI